MHWTCGDALSGVVGSCPADELLQFDGLATISASVADLAGNTATTSVTVSLDRTVPSITGSAVPSPNEFGWNNSPVHVSFVRADATSGVAPSDCPSPVVVNEGSPSSVSGTATDRAGNQQSATVTGVPRYTRAVAPWPSSSCST